jgi:glycosyltransferase involved in cell wall biosynthesis
LTIVTHPFGNSVSGGLTGGQTRMFNFAQSFRNLGHSVEFLSSQGAFAFNGSYRIHVSHPKTGDGLSQHFLKMLSDGPLLTIRAMTDSPDAVIVQIPFPVINVTSALVQKLKGTSVALDFSDTVATTNRHFILRAAHAELLRLGVRSIKNIIVASTRLEREINSLVPASCHVIPNPIDTRGLFDPQKYYKQRLRSSLLGLEKEEEKIVLLYSGYVSMMKGVETIPEIGKKLRDKHKLDRYVFLIVGGGDYLDAMRNRVKSLEIEDSFIFIGRVSPECVPQYLATSDVGLVPPSTLNSGGALKISEYMSMGLPLLLPNQDWFSDGVQDGVNGWVLDSRSFVEKAVTLLCSDFYDESFGQNSRRYAEQELDSTILAKRYLQIFDA